MLAAPLGRVQQFGGPAENRWNAYAAEKNPATTMITARTATARLEGLSTLAHFVNLGFDESSGVE